ncbi:MAG: VOC family protein [Woeseiaceae bacterium]|nr:VOC family protein [Woeseiaceae bacterium]
MFPKMTGIDHIHVYVDDWNRAEKWYQDVLGFKRVEALMAWAVPGGPLTIESADGNVHLALFERDERPGGTAIAFGASADEFLAWKSHLEDKGLKLRVTDHELAYSLYFHDPDNNMHEITTYEHEMVRAELQQRR